MDVSSDQLQQVFGSGALDDIASQLGMSQNQAGSAMSQMLPELINQLTPQGQVTTESNDSTAEALQSLIRERGPLILSRTRQVRAGYSGKILCSGPPRPVSGA